MTEQLNQLERVALTFCAVGGDAVLTTELGDGIALLDLRANEYFTLSGVGALLASSGTTVMSCYMNQCSLEARLAIAPVGSAFPAVSVRVSSTALVLCGVITTKPLPLTVAVSKLWPDMLECEPSLPPPPVSP